MVKNWKIDKKKFCFYPCINLLMGAILDNLKGIIVDAMVLYNGLIKKTKASKFITFGVDGVNVF